MPTTPNTDDLKLLTCAPDHLKPWVEQVWWSRGRLPTPRERVLPSATADIVANLGPPMRLVGDEGASLILGSTVTGLLTRPLVLEHPEVHEAVGVRLAPLGVRAILGVPAAIVRDEVVDLSELLATRVDALARACHQQKTPQARLGAAIDWLAAQLAADTDSDPLVRWVIDQIVLARGTGSIRALQEASGYSATWLTRRVRDELGVTPKQLARIVRFRVALDDLAPDLPLAQLAARVGYADQAHMHRDFRLLASTTPTALLAARYSSGLTMAI